MSSSSYSSVSVSFDVRSLAQPIRRRRRHLIFLLNFVSVFLCAFFLCDKSIAFFSPLFTEKMNEKMRAAALGVEEALEMLRKRREEIRREDAERGKRAEEDSEEDGNGSLLSEGGVLGAGPPKVGSSHEVKLVHLKLMKNNDGMVTVLEKEEEDDGKKTKKTKSSSVKMMMALRYTHERAPAADARKPVRVVRRKNNTTTNNNNERGVVEIEFRNKEEEKSGIRYRGVTSTSGGGGGGGGARRRRRRRKRRRAMEKKRKKRKPPTMRMKTKMKTTKTTKTMITWNVQSYSMEKPSSFACWTKPSPV